MGKKIIQQAIQKKLTSLPPSAQVVDSSETVQQLNKRVQGTQELAGGIFQALDQKVAENQPHMTQGVAFALQKIESSRADPSFTKIMTFPKPGPPDLSSSPAMRETAQIFDPIPPNVLQAMMRPRQQRYSPLSLHIYHLWKCPRYNFWGERHDFENAGEPIPRELTDKRPTLPKVFQGLPIQQGVQTAPVQFSIGGVLFQLQKAT